MIQVVFFLLNLFFFLLVLIFYPNCTNYAGKKLLIYNKGITKDDLLSQKLIDPHFLDNDNYYYPIARLRDDVIIMSRLIVSSAWGINNTNTSHSIYTRENI